MSGSRGAPQLSVVIPMFEEEDNVVPLYEKLTATLSSQPSWEAIFVDDGSRDRTLQVLAELAAADHRLRIVVFRANYGQTSALVAGIDHARGEIIVTMDGDLQNDPADIPMFVEHIEAGYDIVVGWRENRQDALVTRKIPSRIANWIIGKVTGIPIRDNGCSLKAYRARVIKHIPLYSEMHRFIPAMASLAGSRILEIPVRHHARIHGESKYGLRRTYKVVLDLLVIRTLLSCLGNPLKYFATMAAGPVVLALLFTASAMVALLDGHPTVVLIGCAILWVALGLFALLWGVIAELVYRTNDDKESYLARLTTEIS